MLYVHPPFYSYEGVQVVGDYHDPRQFYYYPNRPTLAVDEQGRPAIRFLAYRANLDEVAEGDDHVAGFLVFDTSLAWPADTLRKVAQKIQADLDLDDPPRLAPLPFTRGTVRLMFLDRTTTPPGEEQEDEEPDETEPARERWVTMLESSGVPSLYGENRAIFSAALTKEATALMFGAFEGFMPAGVIYDLTYAGLQRAFNVHVEANWEQVYHHLTERFAVDLVFVSINTQEILDELEQKQLITITASLEGVGEEGMEAEFNQVRRELEQLVLEKFFTPVVNPHQQDPPNLTDGLSTARSIINMVHHWPSVGYQRLELTATEVRSIQADYTMLRAVERRIAPQAHLSLFFEDYRLTRDQVVTVVDGKDAMWQELGFELSANADFGGDGIAGIAADLRYGAPPDAPDGGAVDSWSFLLTKDQPRFKRSAWLRPEVGDRFQYRYTVHFAPAALPGPKLSLSSGWIEKHGTLAVITPAELYQKRSVEAQLARSFPFDRYPQVHVHLRYVDPHTGWRFEDAALLDQGQPRLPFAFRIRRGAPPEVQVQCTYLRADGEVREMPWETRTGDLVLIQDPFPNQLVVRVVVAGDRKQIANLFVDFKYEDDEAGVSESGTIAIDPSTINQAHQWRVSLENPEKRRYSYNQTLIDTDGNVTQTGWIQEERTTLPVGMVHVMRMEVTPELVGPPLGDSGLELIKLTLRYEDAANAVRAEKQLRFAQPGRGEPWVLQLKDAAARDYTYEVVYVQTSGFERRLGPLSARDTFLVVSSTPPEG